MLLGDRREGHALRHLMSRTGEAVDVTRIKHRIFDPTFDLASWVAFRIKQEGVKNLQHTGVTSLSPIPVNLINHNLESHQKDLAIATPLQTSMAIATIDASIRLNVEGQQEPLQFNQRAVRIGARSDYDIEVPQKSPTPETLMLSREGLKWVASSDARRSSLVRVNGNTLTRPVTLGDGDQLEFLTWSATVVLEGLDPNAAPEKVEVRAALMVNGKPFPIRHQFTLIGTSGDNHVILEDRSASMQHAQLHRHGNPAEYVLMDAGSKTGTFVEGRQIFSPAKLLPGQKIQMGESLIELQILEKPKTVESPPRQIIKRKPIAESKSPGSKAASKSAGAGAQPTSALSQTASENVDRKPGVSAPADSSRSGDASVPPQRPAVANNQTAQAAEARPANETLIFLTVEFGLNEGKTYELTLPATIGRSSGADVTIRDTLLSREHCKIEQSDAGYTITDLNSSNGLRVQGNKLESGSSVPVSSGDSIELGRSVMRFETILNEAPVVDTPDSEPQTEPTGVAPEAYDSGAAAPAPDAVPSLSLIHI